MNKPAGQNQDSYRELLLMSELEDGAPISQREIAGRLGIALGLVNNYLKNLAKKGYVQVKAYPRNRFAYLLTPKGFAEKSRLAFQQVGFFSKIFRIVRENSLELFLQLKTDGVEEISFCGIDEFSEIAYLSLCEAGLALKTVMDDQSEGKDFLSYKIISFDEIDPETIGPIAITSFRRTDELRDLLVNKGIPLEKVHSMAVPL